jgi:hypothetical protein
MKATVTSVTSVTGTGGNAKARNLSATFKGSPGGLSLHAGFRSAPSKGERLSNGNCINDNPGH